MCTCCLCFVSKHTHTLPGLPDNHKRQYIHETSQIVVIRCLVSSGNNEVSLVSQPCSNRSDLVKCVLLFTEVAFVFVRVTTILRLCSRADDQVRMLTLAMTKVVPVVYPHLSDNVFQ